MKFLAIGFLAGLAGLVMPGQAASWLQGEKDGRIHTSRIEWGIISFDQDWKLTNLRTGLAVKSLQREAGTEWEGTFRAAGRSWTSWHFLEDAGADTSRLQWTVTPEAPTEVRMLAWEGRLSASLFRGRSIRLDAEDVLLPDAPGKDGGILALKHVKELWVPVEGGRLGVKGSFQVQVVDRRVHQEPYFAVRIFFEPGSGKISKASLTVSLVFEPYRSQQVVLSGVLNRSMADNQAGDGVGGWTDQGPGNDLRTFPGGRVSYGGINFVVPTSGNAALVLSGDKRRSPVSGAEVALEPGDAPAWLYLLHAGAWLKDGRVGKLHCTSADGKQKTLEVVKGRDVADWWNPSSGPNAAVVWQGNNKEAAIGLYLSRFPIPPGIKLTQLGFEAVGSNVWMIVGAATSADPIPLPRTEKYLARRNADWQPLQDSLGIQAGSVLDWSKWNPPGPAGRFGPLRAGDTGHFYFEARPEERVKLFGTSVNFSANFPEKEQAAFLARTLRRQGYNTIRFHHYDVLLTGGWHPGSYAIDAAQMDRLDYFFYRCKEEGLGVATELFTIRRILPPLLRSKMGGDFQAFKALVPVDRDAMLEWKRFARDFLGHRNPYTGLTWAEDPALYVVVPLNEDTAWAALKSNPSLQTVYQEAFRQWLTEHHFAPPDEPSRILLFNEFVAKMHLQANKEMARFLREELDYRGLVSGNNWQILPAQVPIRSEFDYVDNHRYWDHPTFSGAPFRYPFNHSLRSATAALAPTPRDLFLTRVKGKPFAVTEFNYCFPNPFRSEGGALMGAYAARQDWDLIARFGWARELENALNPGASTAFDLTGDPISRLGERFIGVLWFRGDMKPFTEEATYVVNRDAAFSGDALFGLPHGFLPRASLVGLVKRVASVYEPDARNVPSEEFRTQVERDRYDVMEGDCRTVIEREGNFYATTPRSRAMVLQTRSLDENFIPEFHGGPASVLVASLDAKSLDTSEHLLVLHLTDTVSEGTVFADERRASVLGEGNLPHLVRRGSLKVRLPNQASANDIQVFAIGLDGRRLGNVPFSVEGGSLQCTLETIPKQGPTRMIYEIVRSGR